MTYKNIRDYGSSCSHFLPLRNIKKSSFICKATEEASAASAAATDGASISGSNIEINEEFLKKMKEIKVETESNQAQITKEVGQALISELVKAYRKGDFTTAFIAVAIICQKGGTSRKALGDIYAVVNGHRFTLKMIRDVMAAKGFKFTLRQWARTYASDIYTIASHYCIEGDLYKKISRKYPTLDLPEHYWLSNFQMDNPSCPENCRNMIKEHFSTLFPGSTKLLKD